MGQSYLPSSQAPSAAEHFRCRLYRGASDTLSSSAGVYKIVWDTIEHPEPILPNMDLVHESVSESEDDAWADMIRFRATAGIYEVTAG